MGDRVYNFAMDTLDPKHLLKRLDVVFDKLKPAAKFNVAFVFLLKNVEDGSCRFYCPHENQIISERSKLMATPEQLTKNNNFFGETDVIGLRTRERATTNSKFYKPTDVTIFAELPKDVPIGCKGTVLPNPLLKDLSVKCLTFEENTRKPYNYSVCLFRAPALHLHRKERLEEETSKVFNLFLKKN